MLFRSAVLAAGLYLVPVGLAMGANPGPDAGLFQAVAGRWAMKNGEPNACADRAHSIRFEQGNNKMIVEAKGLRGVYNIIYAERNRIVAIIEGEERRTEEGDRVIWMLVLNSPSSYQWRRLDWGANDRTNEVTRCPN